MFQVMSPNKLCNRFRRICFSSQCLVSMKSKSRLITCEQSHFFFKHNAQTVCNCNLSVASVKNIHVLLSFCSYLPPNTFIWSGWTGTTQSTHDYLDHISAIVLPFVIKKKGAFIDPSKGLWGEEKRSGHEIFWYRFSSLCLCFCHIFIISFIVWFWSNRIHMDLVQIG